VHERRDGAHGVGMLETQAHHAAPRRRPQQVVERALLVVKLSGSQRRPNSPPLCQV
jgi:hypothetical protein